MNTSLPRLSEEELRSRIRDFVDSPIAMDRMAHEMAKLYREKDKRVRRYLNAKEKLCGMLNDPKTHPLHLREFEKSVEIMRQDLSNAERREVTQQLMRKSTKKEEK